MAYARPWENHMEMFVMGVMASGMSFLGSEYFATKGYGALIVSLAPGTPRCCRCVVDFLKLHVGVFRRGQRRLGFSVA